MKLFQSLVVVFIILSILGILWWFFSMSEEGGVDDFTEFPVSGPLTESDVKAAFENFLITLSQDSSTSMFRVTGAQVPLRDFVTTLEGELHPELNNLLEQNVWQMYACPDTGPISEVQGLVLSMRFSLQEDYSGNLYADQMQYLREWENSLVEDMSPLIFPDATFIEKPQLFDSFRTNRDYPYIELREATILLPGSQLETIGYVFVGDELLIGNDRECLLRIQESVFETTA